MRIKDIKFERLRELALQQQELQGNKRNADLDLYSDSSSRNFDWGETEQGDEFWNCVDDGSYEEAREIFDWDKEVFKRGEEVEVSNDKVNWHKAIFVDDVSDICPEVTYPIVAHRRGAPCMENFKYVRHLSSKIELTKAEIAERLGIDVGSLVITED